MLFLELPSLGEIADTSRLNQIGGVDPVPVDVHGDSAILDHHMVEVSPRLGVRVGVFRFAASADESRCSQSERERMHSIESDEKCLSIYLG